MPPLHLGGSDRLGGQLNAPVLDYQRLIVFSENRGGKRLNGRNEGGTSLRPLTKIRCR
jgi:hypothetical protein